MGWTTVVNPNTGATEYIRPGETTSTSEQLRQANDALSRGETNVDSYFESPRPTYDSSKEISKDPSGTYHANGSFTPKGGVNDGKGVWIPDAPSLGYISTLTPQQQQQYLAQGGTIVPGTTQQQYDAYLAGGGNLPASGSFVDSNMSVGGGVSSGIPGFNANLDGLLQQASAYYQNMIAQITQQSQFMLMNAQQQHELLMSQLEKNYQSQLEELNMMRDKWIQEGEMSVNEATKEFEARKKEIDQQRYQDKLVTDQLVQALGIQHSQQGLAHVTGDDIRRNQREDSARSDYQRTKDDIRNRIWQLMHDMDIQQLQLGRDYSGQVTDAQMNLNKNLAGIQQWGFESGFGLQKELYDTQQKMAYEDYIYGRDVARQDSLLDRQFDEQKELIDIGHANQKEIMKYSNELAVEVMEADYGYKIKLEDLRHTNTMSEVGAKAQADYNNKIQMLEWERNEAYKSLYNRDSQAYAIRESQIKEQEKMALKEFQNNILFPAMVEGIYSNEYVQSYGLSLEDIPPPKDNSKQELKRYNDAVDAVTAAIKITHDGYDFSPYAAEIINAYNGYSGTPEDKFELMESLRQFNTYNGVDKSLMFTPGSSK